jgi:hypothetical protein
MSCYVVIVSPFQLVTEQRVSSLTDDHSVGSLYLSQERELGRRHEQRKNW